MTLGDVVDAGLELGGLGLVDEVKLIDAESTLVSKAIHAPQKNKQLIRQAIASGKFPGLVDRIIENNGKIDFFLEDYFES